MPASWPIVFMGTPDTAAFTLGYLLQGPDPVVGVVTQPDRPAGRGQKPVSSPVRKLAESHGIPVLGPEKMRDSSFENTLKSWQPQLIVVVAYGRILPAAILEVAPHGCMNVHYSLLPKYRGAAPAAWTIINGEEKSGVTTMKLVEKMDAGPIYLQAEVTLAPDETTASLQARLTPIGARLLLETIEKMKDGSLVSKMQDETEVSFAPILKKQDGLIDWTQPAATIERRIRGFNPWPSAYTKLHGKLMKIHYGKIVSTSATGGPGEVIRADRDGFWVATGFGVLSLEEVQLENRKRLPGGEFLKGTRVNIGDRL
jgi:methionyl-tRNA formyltransferase